MIDKNKNKIAQLGCCDSLWGRTWYSEWKNDDDRLRLKFILTNLKGKSVLDLGCSDGIISIEAARQGLFSVGVNMNSKELEMAHAFLEKEDEYVKNRATFLTHDIEDFETSASFDNIICAEVLEHQVDPEVIVRKIHEIADNSTNIIITVPNRNVKEGYNARWELAGIHIQFFNIDSLSALLGKYFSNITFSSLYDDGKIHDAPFLLVVVNGKK